MAKAKAKAKQEQGGATPLERADALVTGFPGFLTTRLVGELMTRQPKADLYLLIEARFRDEADQRVARLRGEVADYEGEIHLIEGDITEPKLGLAEARYAALRSEVGVVWHLAGLYNLAVPEEAAYRVNVRGTIHVLDFCEACEELLRFNYVSTCYVSGERQGIVCEGELDEAQGHHNHYEATKFWAEVEVQRRREAIPTVILRPSIVVGDSRTGHTDKYDGPYYLFKALAKLPDWMPLPNIGKGDASVAIVPVDYATRAMAHIGLKPGTQGEVYQVSDPNPMRARDIVTLAMRLMDKRPPVGSVPTSLLDRALSSRKLEELVGIPQEAIAYFNHDARYDTTNTQRALAGSGVQCPHLSQYLQVLIDYMLMHPGKG